MARKRSAPKSSEIQAISAERAARLYRLLKLMGKRGQTRDMLTRELHLDVRAFYRDLEVLGKVGIVVDLRAGKYQLREPLSDALNRLLFPDPHLTLAEAIQLAKGRTAAHRKLKQQVRTITG